MVDNEWVMLHDLGAAVENMYAAVLIMAGQDPVGGEDPNTHAREKLDWAGSHLQNFNQLLKAARSDE